jgi:hypothetical protein
MPEFGPKMHFTSVILESRKWQSCGYYVNRNSYLCEYIDPVTRWPKRVSSFCKLKKLATLQVNLLSISICGQRVTE